VEKVRSPVGLPLNFPFAMDAEAGGKANRYGVCSLGVLAAGSLVCFIGQVGKEGLDSDSDSDSYSEPCGRGRHEIRRLVLEPDL
jgi:hypothetical protein